jgi:hypothetical protein
MTVGRGGERSRDTGIGIAVAALAVAAMAVDHLLGDDPGLEDPFTFLLGSGLSLAVAAIVFAGVVPRAKAAGAERAARRALVCSVLSVVALPLVWLGLPFPLAGGGIALGLTGRDGQRRRRATAAIGIGAIVLLLGTAGYAGQAVQKVF